MTRTVRNFEENSRVGYPVLSECMNFEFGRFYFSEACSAAFQALYDNYNGVQEG